MSHIYIYILIGGCLYSSRLSLQLLVHFDKHDQVKTPHHFSGGRDCLMCQFHLEFSVWSCLMMTL